MSATQEIETERLYISEKQGRRYMVVRVINPLEFTHPDNRRYHVRMATKNHEKVFPTRESIKDPFQQVWLDVDGIQVGDYLIRPNVTFLITEIDTIYFISVVIANEVVRLVDRSMAIICNQLPIYISKEKILNTKEIILGNDCFTYTAIMPNIKTGEPIPGDAIITNDGIQYTIFRAELNGSIWTLFLQRQLKS